MGKIERGFRAFCITSIPCFLLAAVIFLPTEGRMGAGIMAVAFSLFLLYACSLSQKVSMLRSELEDCYKKGISDKEADEKEIKGSVCQSCKLEQRVNQLEIYYDNLESRIVSVEKGLSENAEPDEKMKEKMKEKDFREADARQLSDKLFVTEKKRQRIQVNLRLDDLNNKRELTSGESFAMHRNGNGFYLLEDFRMLYPVLLKTGSLFDSGKYETYKSYNMKKLFEFNSEEMIGHKIIKIIPAEISISGNKDGVEFRATFQKAGRIEVDNPK